MTVGSVSTAPKNSISCDYAYIGTKTPAWMAKRVNSVGRYITTTVTSKKVLTPRERDQLFAVGLDIYLIWEVEAARPLRGYDTGYLDGFTATVQARGLGQPAGCLIYAAVDLDVWRLNVAQCEAYVRGFHAGLEHLGSYKLAVYGDHDIAQRVMDICDAVIVPNASAWSSGIPPYNVVARQGRQDLNVGWDFPTVVLREFPVWSGATASKPPVVTPPPQVVTPPVTPPTITPPTPPVSADTALLAAATGEPMFFIYNSDNPTDPKRYWSNGLAYGHIDEASANEMVVIGAAKNTPASALPRTTLQFAQMVRVGS